MKKSLVAAGLCAAALVTGCVSQQTYQAEVKKSNAYQTLSEQLQTEVKSDQIQIQQLQGQVKLTMVDTLLFAEGGWQIHKKGEDTLDKIVPTLKTVKSGRIVVEGYTDNVPIGPALTAVPGSFVYETAATVHTPVGAGSDEIITLNIQVGDSLYLDGKDNIVAVENWKTTLKRYLDFCVEKGLPPVDVSSFAE